MADTARLTLEALADLCLSSLIENPEELARFMQVAGYTPQALQKAVHSRQFALGLVDYVTQNEPLMLAVCANAGIKPEDFMRVWYKANPGVAG